MRKMPGNGESSMKILHLSETTLSGSPIRISNLVNKYTEHESRHMVWHRKVFNRVFPCDLVGEEMTPVDREYWLHWADIVCFHNIYDKQTLFKYHLIPKKPSVIQIHSPREDFDAKSVIDSKLPIAVIAQFHVRQWPEKSFIVPNVVDINDPSYVPINRKNSSPIISFAPSNGNGKGWNNKGYSTVDFFLKRQREFQYQKIFNRPFEECLKMKSFADIGIDDIHTGSYHLSCLEYLALGVATICYTDDQTDRVVKDITGCSKLPWIHRGKDNIVAPLHQALQQHQALGMASRKWMETYWNPKILCDHYIKMYESL
jgi:hypothetical protein